VTSQDQGDCSPSVVPGHRYHVGVWYETDVKATITLFYRDATGRWVYWTSSPTWPTSTTWYDASWTTPPAPSDAKALSFGITIAQVGTITTDDYVVSSGSSGLPPAAIAIVIALFAAAVGGLFVARRRARGATRRSTPPTGTDAPSAKPTPSPWPVPPTSPKTGAPPVRRDDLSTGAYSNESVWNEPIYPLGGGGGLSAIYSRPDFQDGVDGTGGHCCVERDGAARERVAVSFRIQTALASSVNAAATRRRV
jgi:hypothetical protein